MSDEMNDTMPLSSEETAPVRRDYSDELLRLIRDENAAQPLSETLNDYHDSDIADVLEQLSSQERKRLYHVLGLERMSDVFAYLEDVGVYIDELDAEKAADVIEGMDADDAVDVLEELDADKRQELMGLLDSDAVEDIRLIDSYSDDEIGSKMTTNFVTIGKELTIKQAMRSLIRQAADNDNISTLYTLNADGTFYGAIDLKDLIVAREGTMLDDLITTSYPYVYATETIETCIEQLKDYSEDSIPVLSADNHLIGVITAQDIVEVVDEELGEDYARLGGLTAEEDLREPLWMSVRKRIPWLIVLLLLALGISVVIGLFEGVVRSLTLIVCFQSLILDMAGNVGTQSLAVTIRVLMDENLTGRQEARLIFKEMRIGLLNGALLGVLSFAFVGLYIWLLKGKTLVFAFATSGCIGVALLVAMMFSSLVGTAIPLFLKRLHIDPAVASGPLITTLNDLVAVVTYYGLAWILLLQVLQLA